MKPRRRISEFESDSIAMAQVQLGTVVCLCQVRCEYRSILLPVMTRLMRSNRCFSLDFMSRVASSSIIKNPLRSLVLVSDPALTAWVSYNVQISNSCTLLLVTAIQSGRNMSFHTWVEDTVVHTSSSLASNGVSGVPRGRASGRRVMSIHISSSGVGGAGGPSG
jgi:hypothetical protein